MKKTMIFFSLLILFTMICSGKTTYADNEDVALEIVDWGMKEINVEKAHANGLTGKGIKIAVLDSGVDKRPSGMYHEDLKIEYADTFIPEKEDYINDMYGHGTHVTGIIGAQINGIGTIGVAPDAEIYSLKVGNEAGIDRRAVNRAIEWCINNGIDIINYSAGSNTEPQDDIKTELNHLISYANMMGIIIVVSTGNGNENNVAFNYVGYPAENPNVLAVGSVGEDLTLSTFSNYGNGLDFVAPGENVYSSWYGNTYRRENGTSMAAPHVTGMVALYKQRYPGYTKDQIIEEMKKNAIDLGEPGYDIFYGNGLIQPPPDAPKNDSSTGVYFNGYDQYGKSPININYDVMPTTTIECWVKPERVNFGNRQDILSQDDGGYDRSIIIESNSNKWGIFTGDGVWTPATVDANQWQHIAVTYTSDNIYFYKNGEKFDYNKETGNVPTKGIGHEFITIGKNYSYGEEFKGVISDMRIWDKVLTTDELNKPTSGIYDSYLKAQWDLDGVNEDIGYEQIQLKNFTFYNNPKLYKEKIYFDSNNSVDYDTSKADVQVKVGDIDNFGFGFNSDYDPFLGIETANNHDYPFEPESDDFDGTDRIMIPSSFDYNNPAGFVDGYVTKTQGKDNTVRPIEMVYDLKGKSINAAKIQLFVDDFQPADLLVNSHFTFKLNGIEISTISQRINLLQQTGPKGVLMTFDIPKEYLYLLNGGIAKIEIDDTTTGVGDGYAIDFAQLLINPKLN